VGSPGASATGELSFTCDDAAAAAEADNDDIEDKVGDEARFESS